MSEDTTTMPKTPLPANVQEAKRVLQEHKRLNPGRPRKQPPVLTPTGDTKMVTLTAVLGLSSEKFSRLRNGKRFSLDTDGAVIYVKKSKYGAINLMSGEPISVADAAVYEVLSLSIGGNSGK